MIATTHPRGRPPHAPTPSPTADAPLCGPEPRGAAAVPISFGSLAVVSGDTAITLWGGHDTAVSESSAQVQLRLEPHRPVVIGRLEGQTPPYLDPSYRSTRVVPGTGQSVVRSGSQGKDVAVSRAHFMLRGDARGIVLTNGVPRVGGGIRPPMNGTWLWGERWRLMDPAEEYLIEYGMAAILHLPNGTVVRIRAE
jgi:hypothetical protein